MVAQERADVFLRHRGAVLDTLLADPAFGRGAVSETASAAPDPQVGGPAAVAVAAAPPRVSVESAPMAPGASPGEFMAGAPSSGEVYRGDPSVPGPRRTAAGPKASERILALLNGETSPAAAGLEYSGEFSEVASKLTAPSTPAPEATAAPSRPISTSRSAAAPTLQGLLIQIKKPKVALTLAAVLVVLLVVVLITTSGGDKNSSQVAVITPAPAPASTSPQPATPTTPADAPIQVKSAASHCPPGGTPGMDAFSGDGKAWSCSRAYSVDGQVLTIDLGRTFAVDSIGIVPGWDHVGTDGTDEWAKYRTVSRVSYRFNDQDITTYTQQTMDQRMLVVTKMNPSVRASKVILTVLASKGDPSVNTTAISSIVISGH
ncbi:hypothetical protein ABIA39_006264 [Nocardia sp. GAS34]|uniref:hypothetical protein n=1 Tax=unclassified Nocardia TaxID=2637762 RepID=UPI003D1F4B26